MGFSVELCVEGPYAHELTELRRRLGLNQGRAEQARASQGERDRTGRWRMLLSRQRSFMPLLGKAKESA